MIQRIMGTNIVESVLRNEYCDKKEYWLKKTTQSETTVLVFGGSVQKWRRIQVGAAVASSREYYI